MPANESQPPSAPIGSSFIGRTLGDFTIRAEIGRGGMGTVFVADQISMDRQVALKVLHAGPGMSETAVARFKREAQAAGRLTHRNIVPIFGQGEQDGIYYYTMELVQGRSLIRIIEEQRGASGDSSDADETVVLGSPGSGAADVASSGDDLPTEKLSSSPDDTAQLAATRNPSLAFDGPSRFDRIAELIASVADALDYAHRSGVIHRDIKPHNLMLSDDGRLCITDFGLARVVAEPGMTVTGEFIGSPRYMSPEQIRGTSNRVDHRSDIYSLGATLYEWLALSPPFPGETREQVIVQVLTGDPVALRSHSPEIPIDLETICLKALEREPSRRYQSAGHMRDDLLRFSQRHAIRARRSGLLGRVRKFVARHQGASMAAAALVIAVILTSALVFERTVNTQEQRGLTQSIESLTAEKQELQEKVDQFQDLEGLLDLGMRLGKDLPMPNLGFGASDSVGAPTSLVSPAERHFVDHLVPSLLEGFLQRTAKGDRHGRSGGRLSGYRRAIQDGDTERAWKMLRPRLEGDPEDIIALELRAILACRRGQYRRMQLDAERMIKMEPASLQGYWLRALALVFGSRVTEALADIDLLMESGWRDAWVLTARGAIFARQQAWEKARSNLEAAIALSPNHTAALCFRAEILTHQGEHARAVIDLSEVIRQEPDNHMALGMRGEYYEVLGQYNLAADDYSRAYGLSASPQFLWDSIRLRATRGDTSRPAPTADASNPNLTPTPTRVTTPAVASPVGTP